MRDIETTEADREEAYAIRELQANDGITVWPEFVMDIDEASKGLARIRADAVKAERENASRLAQEARADERAIVEREVAAKLSDPVVVYTNALRGTIDVSEVRADERRRFADSVREEITRHAVAWIIANKNTEMMDLTDVNECVESIMSVYRYDHDDALLQGTEPAKVSEDAEMIEDAALIGEAIKTCTIGPLAAR